jgi:oligoribonuclease (3'-5' exoribonuclease)
MWPTRTSNPFDLHEEDKYSVVIKHDGLELGRHLSPFTWRMHGKSNLLAEVIESKTTLPVAEKHMIDRLINHEQRYGSDAVWYLAGNSIHFDAAFLKWHMGDLAKRLNHRILDITSLLLFAMSPVFGADDLRSEPAHRAMADIETSIAAAEKCAAVFDARRVVRG